MRMRQPCFFNLVHKPCQQGTFTVAKIENPGLLDQLGSGEWYLHWSERVLYYAPLPGEDARSLEAVLPISEGLLHAAAGGVANVSFVNVTFAHDAWAGPNGPDGYVEQQSGARIVGGGVTPHSCEACWMWTPANGSIHLEATLHMAFEGCTFKHLGSVSALSLMVADASIEPAQYLAAPTRLLLIFAATVVVL